MPEPMRPPPPSAAANSRMQVTLGWMPWLETVDAKIVWLRASGTRWKAICWAVGLTRAAAHEHWLYALCVIAWRLNGRERVKHIGRRRLIALARSAGLQTIGGRTLQKDEVPQWRASGAPSRVPDRERLRIDERNSLGVLRQVEAPTPFYGTGNVYQPCLSEDGGLRRHPQAKRDFHPLRQVRASEHGHRYRPVRKSPKEYVKCREARMGEGRSSSIARALRS
jgi:hypothetical protein